MSVLDELAGILPDDVLVLDEAAVAARAHDEAAAAPLADGAALALVRARSTDDVAATLRVAHAHGVPVVPQGALTGLAGAADAVPGAILLDLSGMDRVLRIDPVDQVAVVEPGVLVADLQAAVAEQGLFYPPDPASASRATVGGTIATNAGGMRCVKYGVTRDFVRSLQVVLADGTVLDTRATTVKAVAGYDLTGLVVGSEGTLAVVTQATLGLLPAPGPERGVSATFASVPDALAAADAIVGGPHRPSTLELLDGVVAGAVAAYAPSAGVPEGAGAWLLAVTDERGDATATLDAYADAMRAAGALAVEVGASPEALDSLLAARRAFQPAMRALRGGSLNGDVSVPRSRLGELIDRLADIAAARGVLVATGGHVGDGNLHPVVAFDPADPAQTVAAHAAMSDVLRLARSLGGTVTGEHGIGVEKLEALDDELGPDVRALQRAIKTAFDPTGILNPGKKL